MTARGRFEEKLLSTFDAIIALLRPMANAKFEKHFVWHRTGPTNWRGEWEERPVPPDCLESIDWRSFSDSLEESFRQEYPSFPVSIGTTLTGWCTWDLSGFLRLAVYDLWKSLIGFEIDEKNLRSFAKELCYKLNDKALKFEFLAPLVNFDLEEGIDRVELLDQVTLIRMTPEQISRIYGWPDYMLNGPTRMAPVPCALTGSFLEAVSTCEDHPESVFYSSIRLTLDRIVLALQTFSAAPIAIDFEQFSSSEYSPFVIGAGARVSTGDAFVPSNRYCLHNDDVARLKAHLAMFVTKLHPVLEIACSRYSSATLRKTPQDALLDAIMGLEAVLLYETGSDRGELSYRLALRYATITESAGTKRQSAFRTMRDLYKARNSILHSGSGAKHFKVDGKEYSPQDLATKAREMLRTVLLTFLPDGQNPRFTRSGFWEEQLFGEKEVSVGRNPGASGLTMSTS